MESDIDRAIRLYSTSKKLRGRADMLSDELGELLADGKVTPAELTKRTKVKRDVFYTRKYLALKRRRSA